MTRMTHNALSEFLYSSDFSCEIFHEVSSVKSIKEEVSMEMAFNSVGPRQS